MELLGLKQLSRLISGSTDLAKDAWYPRLQGLISSELVSERVNGDRYVNELVASNGNSIIPRLQMLPAEAKQNILLKITSREHCE